MSNGLKSLVVKNKINNLYKQLINYLCVFVYFSKL